MFKNDEIIARFMNKLERDQEYHACLCSRTIQWFTDLNKGYYVTSPHYSKSFDSLLPVIEKLEVIKISFKRTPKNKKLYCTINFYTNDGKFRTVIGMGKDMRECACKAVVKAIEEKE